VLQCVVQVCNWLHLYCATAYGLFALSESQCAHCGVLQCVAVCCSGIITVHYSVLQFVVYVCHNSHLDCATAYGSFALFELQCVLVCCIMLYSCVKVCTLCHCMRFVCDGLGLQYIRCSALYSVAKTHTMPRISGLIPQKSH